MYYMPGSSSTAHSTLTRQPRQRNSTETRQTSTATRHPRSCSQARQARQVLDRYSTGTRLKLDRLDRHGLDSEPRDSQLDRFSASTAPRRSLDSSTARQPGLNHVRATWSRFTPLALPGAAVRAAVRTVVWAQCTVLSEFYIVHTRRIF